MTREYRNHTEHVFEVVGLGATKTCKCSVCGKSMKRSSTFEQTLNPFNKTAQGKVKTREQILDELREEIKVWEQQPETHQKCAP